MENISLISSLRKSFSLIFSNLALFIPYLISIGLSFVLFVLPFADILAQMSVPDAQLPSDFLFKIILISIFGGILSLLFYGWIYAAIRPVVMGEKLALFSELRPGIRLSLTLLLQFILAGLLLIAVALAGAVIGALIYLSYSLSFAIGIALTIIGVVIGIAVLLVLSSVLMFAGAAVIVKRCGALESIKQGLFLTKMNLKMSLQMILLSLLLILIFYLPLFPFLIATSDGLMIAENFIGYTLISTLLSLPSMVAMSAVFILYSLVFKDLNDIRSVKETAKKTFVKKSGKKKK